MEYHYTQQPSKTNTFLDRLKNTIKSSATGFLSFLEGLLFLIIRLFPYLVIIALIRLIFGKQIKAAKEKRREKKAAKQSEKQDIVK
jgi:predicted lipid-binding transport protein (Tim44 family)